MIEFIRQLTGLFTDGRVGLFFFFFLFVWGLWGLKVATARRYRPYEGHYAGAVSVIIPVVDEPVDEFREVLRRIARQTPGQIIVVINGKKNEPLETVVREFEGVLLIHLPQPSKREAVAAGVARSTGDVIVLCDSDTLWEPDMMRELLRPFADPTVGGVTTHQEISNPDVNMMTRFATWMERARSHWSMPAMSVHGTVGCLPGRTIAFRTIILKRAMHEFLTDKFLGFHCEVSDDRTLTNICLKQGYKTVYQRPARIQTAAPTTLKKFIKQQLRWSRGSQYNTLRMTPWMLKNARFLGLLYWAEILIPLWLAGIYLYTATMAFEVGGADRNSMMSHAAIAMLGSIVSLTARQIWIYRGRWGQAVWLPAILIMVTILMVPIRVAGFVTMGANFGWGTRDGAFKGRKGFSWKQLIPAFLGVALIGGFYLLDSWVINA